MNQKNSKKFVNNDCCENNRIYWPPLKAIDISAIPLPQSLSLVELLFQR